MELLISGLVSLNIDIHKFNGEKLSELSIIEISIDTIEEISVLDQVINTSTTGRKSGKLA